MSAERWPDARAAFERAVEIDCDNEAAKENLAAMRRALSLGEGPGARVGGVEAR